MTGIFSAAVQCNGAFQLTAWIALCVTCVIALIVLAVVVIKSLNTVITYHKVSVKAKTSRVDFDVNLSR